MKKPWFIIVFLWMSTLSFAQESPTANLNALLDNWHKAAAEADFETYFSYMASSAVFIGTDPSEHWSKKAFMAYAKPYFDKGKAWEFECVNRKLYRSKVDGVVWFDEQLLTQMGLCRGSGVLQKENGEWKIVHYVLSISIPNAKVPDVIELKKDHEAPLIEAFKKK